MAEELPTIKLEDFGKKDIADLPVVRGHAPKGVSDKAREASGYQLKYDVWNYYVNGITDYRSIEEKTGVPYSTIGRWIRGDIKRIAADRDDLAENFLEVELQRLDKMLELLMRDVGCKLIDVTVSEVVGGMPVKGEDGKETFIGGKMTNRKDTHLLERVDVDIIDRILKVQERRAKYLALDKPRQTDADSSNDFDLAELCKAAKLLQEGKMPKEFIDAEFKEMKNGKKESQEEGGEKEGSSPNENASDEEVEEREAAQEGGEAEEEIFIIEDEEEVTYTGNGEEDTLGFDESFFRDE